MADVFLSYTRNDAAVAERFADALRTEGFTVWWDDALTPRASWDVTVDDEINKASCVLVLWSPQSVASRWVRAEAYHGYEAEKLIPVTIEPCALPVAFQMVQAVDLAGWSGAPDHPRWRKLMAWIDDLRRRRLDDGGEPQAREPRKSGRRIVGKLANGEEIEDGAFVTSAAPAGTLFRDSDAAPVMRVLPPGRFLLGAAPDDSESSNVEKPQKLIEFARPFAMTVYPVIRRQYHQFRPAEGAPAPSARGRELRSRSAGASPPAARWPSADPDAAVNEVSFADAVAFANRLSGELGRTYRLPSEAEWEYACRAGSVTRYADGDAIDPSQAVFRASGGDAHTGPRAPGERPPNAFGLFDMHGNVREWTMDYWHESYATTPADGRPALDGHAAMRVVRGGGWSDPATALRSSARGRATETIRSDVIGFRLVCHLD